MRKIYLRNTLIGLSFILILTSAIMSASGPGGGYSNAPNESNCTSCHSGSIITSGNSNLNNFRLSGNFVGNGYVPDSTYDIEITFKQTGISKFGFEVTCLDQSNDPIGTFTSTNSRTSKTTASISGKTRQYIQHTNSGTSSVGTDSTRWTFKWKAPSSNVGNVTFYAVINATNSNNTTSGDMIYGKTFQIGPSSLLPQAIANTNDSVTCHGYNVQLNGSGSNSPTSFAWKLTGGVPSASTSQNPTVVYNSPGTKLAILTVKNSLGTSEPDTQSIIVNLTPSATILNGSAAAICPGDSLLLSANTGANISYQWQHNNANTRTLYVKDTMSYTVKVTSTTNGCLRLSSPFQLNWYGIPTISINKTSTSDTFCDNYNEVFTASGNLIDSVYWYVNGTLNRRTSGLSTTFTGKQNINVLAVAKSINGCISNPSNTVKMLTVPKIYPSNFVFSKTTSNIQLNWKKSNGITAYQFALDKTNFSNTSTDSSLSLTGLQPNTIYTVTIRSIQASPCGFSDTNIIIKTNACSNLAYSIDFNPRTCIGNSMTATVNKLFNSKYSIAFNGSSYGMDTVFTFNPIQSDTLRIFIIDSLSPTCPNIEELIAYTIDTLPDLDTTSTAKQIGSCSNSYEMILPTGYSSYEFYKNNILINSGTSETYSYLGLLDGDQLTAKGIVNTCSKLYGPITMTIYPKAVATYTYSRAWKTYNFTADQLGLTTYIWKTGTDILGNSAIFSKDMSAYNNAQIEVVLLTETSNACKDSSSQIITVPNLSSIIGIGSNSIRIFPNPFNQSITVENKMDNYRLTVMDFQGRIVSEMNSEAETTIINTENWSAGIYYLIIKDQFGHVNKFTLVKH